MKGLGSPIKRAKVLAHLKSLQPDIILLQLTHAKHNVQSVFRTNWLGQAYHANFGAKARGVAMLFRRNIPFIQNSRTVDPDGRYTVYLIVEVNLNSTPVTLVNIYSHNFDCPEFFQKIF